MSTKAWRVPVCLFLLVVAACAERSATGGSHPVPPPESAQAPASGDAIEATLYPAELVMDHQAAIGLDETQATVIRGELQTTQQSLVTLEWRMRGEKESLRRLLAARTVDEPAAITAAQQVARSESEMELAHLRLLVRVKNTLRPDQRARLDALRR